MSDLLASAVRRARWCPPPPPPPPPKRKPKAAPPPQPEMPAIRARFAEPVWRATFVSYLPPAVHVTIEYIQKLISNIPPALNLTVERIQRFICQEFNISKVDLKSSRRTSNVVLPRQIAFWLCKNLTTRSLPDIGRRFGGKDHTTVLHGVRRIEALAQSDEAMRNRLAHLYAGLKTKYPQAPCFADDTE